MVHQISKQQKVTSAAKLTCYFNPKTMHFNYSELPCSEKNILSLLCPPTLCPHTFLRVTGIQRARWTMQADA